MAEYRMSPEEERMSTPFTVVLMDSGTFLSWKENVIKILTKKKKEGFLDGSLKIPPTDSFIFSGWNRVNNILCSWIKNSLHHDVGIEVQDLEYCHEIWNYLEEKYGFNKKNPVLEKIHCNKSEAVEASILESTVKEESSSTKTAEHPVDLNIIDLNCESMSKIELHGVETPKLTDSSSYFHWKSFIDSVLMVHEGMRFVDGTMEVPKQGSFSYRVWEKLDKKIRSIIIDSVGENIKNKIQDMTNSKEIWSFLLKSYAPHQREADVGYSTVGPPPSNNFFNNELSVSANVLESNSEPISLSTDHVTECKILMDSASYVEWESYVNGILLSGDDKRFLNGSMEMPKEGLYVQDLWKRLDNKIKKLITNTLGQNIQKETQHMTTSREIWLYLEKAYAPAKPELYAGSLVIRPPYDTASRVLDRLRIYVDSSLKIPESQIASNELEKCRSLFSCPKGLEVPHAAVAHTEPDLSIAIRNSSGADFRNLANSHIIGHYIIATYPTCKSSVAIDRLPVGYILQYHVKLGLNQKLVPTDKSFIAIDESSAAPDDSSVAPEGLPARKELEVCHNR
ncbi:hypothetical protein KY285_011119 [Solanum tuberosum]|nr:hypothetical protein KY289_012847 [Solanum tuberosum]KAH0735412.1 hypothetical protein KY285_011119 [Solanum tuberosum]